MEKGPTKSPISNSKIKPSKVSTRSCGGCGTVGNLAFKRIGDGGGSGYEDGAMDPCFLHSLISCFHIVIKLRSLNWDQMTHNISL